MAVNICTPGNFAAIATLSLPRDLDSLIAGVLPPSTDAARRGRLGDGLVAELLSDKRADDRDLVSVDGDFCGLCKPLPVRSTLAKLADAAIFPAAP
ncbi:MAG: hypothetical protein HQ526_00350 [Actinobacteria bacterium]|nr:hypothetical protein [Actinomycetota bacterium]